MGDKAVEAAKKREDQEPDLKNNLTELPDAPNGMSGSGGKNGGKNGGSNSGTYPYKYGSTDSLNQAAKDALEKSLKRGRDTVGEYSRSAADEKNFDFGRGNTKEGYIDFGTLRKEKDVAKDALEEAEKGNENYQSFIKAREYYNDKLKWLKKNAENGKYDPEELKKQLEDTENKIATYDRLLKDKTPNEELIYGFDRSLDTDYAKEIKNLENQRKTIQERIAKGEEWQNVVGDVNNFSSEMMKSLGLGIDEYGKIVANSDNPDDEAKLSVMQSMFGTLNDVLADGQVTPEESKKFKEIYSSIDELIKKEREGDKNIMDAEDRYKSADAKFGHYLFDQIKSMIVFVASLAAGNPQMVYSALDKFNNKISDAEADYRTNRIKAFSNNDVKEITGQADAQYDLEQLVPSVTEKIMNADIDSESKARAVRGLEKAFEEYKKYTENPNRKDFAAWFAAQMSSGNGWASLIRDVVGGASANSDYVKELLKGYFGIDVDSALENASKGAKGGSGAMLDTQAQSPQRLGYGSNMLESIINGVLGGAADKKNAETKTLRDKQGTVGNAIASRMGGQGAAPQGPGSAQPVNTSWGNA